MEVATEWFIPVAPSDPERARLDPNARGQCLKADLAGHGIGVGVEVAFLESRDEGLK